MGVEIRSCARTKRAAEEAASVRVRMKGRCMKFQTTARGDQWMMLGRSCHGRKRLTGEKIAADGMLVKVASVNFKVEPVEGEGLDEGENGFAVKPGIVLGQMPRKWAKKRCVPVETQLGIVLVQNRNDRITQDQSDEGIGSSG